MKLIKTAVVYITGRPFILLYPAAIALILCISDIYNPVSSLLLGLTSIAGGNLADGIISILQIALDSAYLPIIGAILALAIIIVSLAGGFFMSGYFYVLDKAAGGIKKSKGEFFEGVRRFYLKITGRNFAVLTLGALISILAGISLVPAAVVSRAALGGKTGFVAAAVFMCLLTLLVVFFILIFFRAYLFFWYPAVYSNKEKPFSAAKQIVDKSFWHIAGRFLIFDILFIADLVLLQLKNTSALFFIISWFIKMSYMMLLPIYVFGLFRKKDTTL